MNLRRHLYQLHSKEYDNAVLQHKWTYKLLSKLGNTSNVNACNQYDWGIPSFSLAAFVEHLVRFIVADDQVSPDDLAFLHTLKGL